ncbi:hypothetical protein SPONL_696 [uncultured Candidatus Thioglobus sp.]|nr:hypothetical protein SPONL_696 [uncultured Candidatus Thioglobus sp.]
MIGIHIIFGMSAANSWKKGFQKTAIKINSTGSNSLSDCLK